MCQKCDDTRNEGPQTAAEVHWLATLLDWSYVKAQRVVEVSHVAPEDKDKALTVMMIHLLDKRRVS